MAPANHYTKMKKRLDTSIQSRYSGKLLLYISKRLFDMALNLDLPPFLHQIPFFINDEGGSFNPHILFAEIFLQLPYIICFSGFMLFI